MAIVHCDGCGRTYETSVSAEALEVVNRCGFCGRRMLRVVEAEDAATDDQDR